MKTSRKIRASFSDNTVDLNLPQGWGDLSSDELSTVYDYQELYDGSNVDVRFPLFVRFGDITIGHQDPVDHKYSCIINTYKDGELQNVVVRLSPEMIAEWIDELNWISNPGDVPVRVDTLCGASAVDAMFHGVDFQTYYMTENYYQGYIMSKDPAAIAGIERLLYPGTTADNAPGLARILNILNWMVQIKTVFSRTFPHFFQPSGGDSATEMPNMMDVMNNQIRALTGGDVTKEDTINKIDCWRALTELDFKAKEAEEFRRQQAKLKK